MELIRMPTRQARWSRFQANEPVKLDENGTTRWLAGDRRPRGGIRYGIFGGKTFGDRAISALLASRESANTATKVSSTLTGRNKI